VKGISDVLSVCRGGAELPVAFFSRQLKDRERNYSVTELESLTVKAGVQHFEIYLHGKEFTVQTDHCALESLLSSRELNAKLTRWAMFVQQFSMKITCRPGIKNQNADGLSTDRLGQLNPPWPDVGSPEGEGAEASSTVQHAASIGSRTECGLHVLSDCNCIHCLVSSSVSDN
jgi:hypothetical protein